ncbi:MAG: class I SAM-dependent methyltransferase [Polyangiaceae bacterium]|nr:class I SAM-dependent methyltransferase [Polyangiaceae bacterium]
MRRISCRAAVALLTAAFIAAGTARSQEPKDNVAGPYVPTPWPIVDDLLKLADITAKDTVYDLGSGDGRLVIEAAKRYGARGTGIELDPKLVALAAASAKREGVDARVRFVQGDLFETSFADASVVTLYLLPRFVTRLVPRFREELKPGTRIVSHDYPLSPWPPDKTLQFDVEEKEPITGSKRTVLYYYVVPARIGGAWRLSLPEPFAGRPLSVEFQQDIENTSGVARSGQEVFVLRDPSVRGERVRFGLLYGGRLLRFEGTISGKSIAGEVTVSGEPAPRRWTAVFAGPPR